MSSKKTLDLVITFLSVTKGREKVRTPDHVEIIDLPFYPIFLTFLESYLRNYCCKDWK